jgi:hypothetical protein
MFKVKGSARVHVSLPSAMGHKALAAAGPGWPYETWTPGAPCQGRLLENRVIFSKGNVLSV